MASQNVPLISFNRGIISPLALARVDIKRTALSAEEQTNWMPRLLGSTMLRPGFEYIGATKSNAAAVHVPFIFSNSDTAIIELTNLLMRVRVDEALVTRLAVSTALTNTGFANYVTNGTFATDTAWTKGANWTIAAGVATAATASSDLSQTCPVTLVAGRSYSVTMTITRSGGSLTPVIGGTNGTARSAAGTYTETIVAGASQAVAFTGSGFIGTLDNVLIEPIDTGWQDKDESGATSLLADGTLTFSGTGYAAAIREQLVTVAGGDQNIEHALRVTVTKGQVVFSVGSSSAGDEYVTATTLEVGIHSLAFTPAGNFYVRFASTTPNSAWVTGCTIESAGVMEIATPWITADLPYIRTDQSADVIYLACNGTYQQRKIQRRGTHSWSLVLYRPDDGPFQVQNTGKSRLTASGISGDITLTASSALFKSTNIGSLYKLSSTGQLVTLSAVAEDQYTDPVRVLGTSGSGADAGQPRSILISLSGTWSATVTLQRSSDGGGTWVDVLTYTVNGDTYYNDLLDNQIVHYRLGIKAGEYSSGTAVLTLNYASGSITGIVRITAFANSTSVSAEVLTTLGGTASTDNWAEGEWSDRRGWPSAGILHQGRLCWGGKGKLWASVSDAYESYDSTVVGDSGPINRSIGSGAVDSINWLARIKRLIVGTSGAEWTVQASSLDEPLTASNFGLDDPSTQGSAMVAAIKVDDRCLFVQKSGQKLFQMKSTGDAYGSYGSSDLNELCPEIGRPSFVRIAAQRQPDTRVHCVRSDGKVAVLVSQPAEEVLCWVLVETDGLVEDVLVMPGTEEDQVYYLVRRAVNGSTVRYLEKWALESECQGGSMSKLADSHVAYEGAATSSIAGLDHLEGEEVVAWGDGRDLGTYTVASGTVNLSQTVTEACVGLGYEARFKSAKLAFAAQMGTALTQAKTISNLGLILANTHYQGLKYGTDFETDDDGEYIHLDDLPLVEDGVVTAAHTVWDQFDSDKIAFNGEWDTDSRLCVYAQAPRPCTVLGCVMGLKTSG